MRNLWAALALTGVVACTRPMAPLIVPVPLDPPAGSPAPAATPTVATKPATKNQPPAAEPSGDRPKAVALAPNVPGGDVSLSPAVISDALDRLRDRQLLIPVANAGPDRIHDSFAEARDGDRVHRATDILAPRGTPVLSADDGKILKMTPNDLGGNATFTVSSDGKFVYYYAHMDQYAKSAFVGKTISKGDTLGYVGTTGNAPKDTPHLHFQIMLWPSDNKYWDGPPINPYPVLHEVNATPHRFFW